MDPLNLHDKTITEQLTILSVRHDLLRRLWPEEQRIKKLFVASVIIISEEKDGAENRIARDFLTGVFSLLQRPTDLIDLCAALPDEELGRLVLELFTYSPVANADLIAALVADPATYARLPQKGDWVGRALLRRAMILRQDFPKRQFEIEEFIPIGIDADPLAARSILGSALDEDELTEASASRLLELFPGDKYLSHALSIRYNIDTTAPGKRSESD